MNKLMTRFIITCPRCKYKMNFAPTKIKVNDLHQCLNCKLNVKVINVCLPDKGKEVDVVSVEPLITNGIEIESYLIKGDKVFERTSIQPIRDVVEPGEDFTEDIAIGNEYISPVFDDINEGFFLLRNGLRKYRIFAQKKKNYQIGLFGTWLKDPAGVHFHIGLGEEGIEKKDAGPLMVYIHDYLPFILALCANSPVYEEELTPNASNRVVKYGDEWCKSISKPEILRLRSDHWVEINYNAHRKDKPPTIEVRIADTNIPEYIIAAVEVLRVLTIAYLSGKPSPNEISFENYNKSKLNAAKYGVEGKIYWNEKNLEMHDYIDTFFDSFHKELEEKDLTDEILDVFRLAKLGWNNATIVRNSIEHIKSVYSSKKFNWKKQFLMRYSEALSSSLDGNNLIDYARLMFVDLPDLKKTNIGKEYLL